jgi:hypothetical protein
MFCKKRHYKNPICFGPYSRTIFRGRPSFLVHLLPFSCLLRHLSFLGMWPYAFYLYVYPVYLSLVVQSTTRQHTLKDEALTALFKDPVRTAL